LTDKDLVKVPSQKKSNSFELQVESQLVEVGVYVMVSLLLIYLAFYLGQAANHYQGLVFLGATLLTLVSLRARKLSLSWQNLLLLSETSLFLIYVWFARQAQTNIFNDPFYYYFVTCLAVTSWKFQWGPWRTLGVWSVAWVLGLGLWAGVGPTQIEDLRGPASIGGGALVWNWNSWGLAMGSHALVLGLLVNFVTFTREKIQKYFVGFLSKRQEKYYSLGMISASLGHELSTPLTSLKGFLEILKNQLHGSASAELNQVLERMEFNVNRMVDITRTLKGFIHSESVPQQTKASELIDDLRYLLEHHLSSKKIEFEISYTDAVYDFVWNVNRVEVGQILFNLVSNARDAVEAKSDRKIKVVLRSFGVNSFVIEVHDSGDGVPQYLREKIFDSEFSTKEFGTGTGLGLWLSRELAHKNQLFLECTENSSLTGGAVFRVGPRS
jgi:signal transduction histidine kinase